MATPNDLTAAGGGEDRRDGARVRAARPMSAAAGTTPAGKRPPYRCDKHPWQRFGNGVDCPDCAENLALLERMLDTELARIVGPDKKAARRAGPVPADAKS